MDVELLGICPFTTTQVLLQGKWAMLMMHHICDGPIRFNELQRRLPKMTNATLSSQLKKLEKFGLIERKMYDEMPLRVEYSVTEMGAKFRPVFDSIETFGNEYIAYMKEREVEL